MTAVPKSRPLMGGERVPARRRLTASFIEALPPAASGQYDVMDDVIGRLGVRVTDKGTKSYTVYARFPGGAGATRRRLGDPAIMTVADARAKAREWLLMVEAGRDPAVVQADAREGEEQRRAATFESVAWEFLKRQVIGAAEFERLSAIAREQHPDLPLADALARTIRDPTNRARPKMRKAPVYVKQIAYELIKPWGRKPITDIRRADVNDLLDAMVERGSPYSAHNVLGLIRRLFNWAISRERYGLEHSPCDRLKPRDAIGHAKVSRSRVLSDVEIVAFWQAAEKLGYPWGPCFQLLLLLGQRRSEIGEARWSEIDLTNRLWVIPPERMKTGLAHTVPLPDDAVAILQSLPRFKRGDYLFSSTTPGHHYFGEFPIRGFGKAKARLDARMREALGELEPFVTHDLRRTMRTRLSSLPIPDEVRETMIAHTRPGIKGVYDLHGYDNEKRHGFKLWAARLKSIVAPPPDNVVSLPAAVS
jgi:integrase